MLVHGYVNLIRGNTDHILPEMQLQVAQVAPLELPNKCAYPYCALTTYAQSMCSVGALGHYGT